MYDMICPVCVITKYVSDISTKDVTLTWAQNSPVVVVQYGTGAGMRVHSH